MSIIQHQHVLVPGSTVGEIPIGSCVSVSRSVDCDMCGVDFKGGKEVVTGQAGSGGRE